MPVLFALRLQRSEVRACQGSGTLGWPDTRDSGGAGILAVVTRRFIDDSDDKKSSALSGGSRPTSGVGNYWRYNSRVINRRVVPGESQSAAVYRQQPARGMKLKTEHKAEVGRPPSLWAAPLVTACCCRPNRGTH